MWSRASSIPNRLAHDDDPDIDAALANQVDIATGEVAQALVETGRSLAHLHALRRAAEERGFRLGHRSGALAVGWAIHALARPRPQQGEARPRVARPSRRWPMDLGLANRVARALMCAMSNSRKTHHLRPREPLALCGAPAWLVAIVPAVVEPTCATCRKIRAFRGRARKMAPRRRP